ncbi:MAG: secretin N-terminal domain-containing protein, partial [Planctomycetota bacterium]
EHQQGAIRLVEEEEYYGIGVAFDLVENARRITQVIPDTPAEKAGLKPGEIIRTVNGRSIASLSQSATAAVIVGAKGTQVTLTVQEGKIERTVTLERQFALEGWPGLQEYQWYLEAYKAGKTWPEYRDSFRTGGSASFDRQHRIFELKYADASLLSGVLRSLLTPDQGDVRIIASPGSNRLIIQAGKKEIEQMSKLIQLLDVAQAGTRVEDTVTQIVQFKYADSQEVAAILENLSVVGRNTRIVPDVRLNQLIIKGTEADLERIVALIKEIDKPVDEMVATKQSVARDKQLGALIEEREALAGEIQLLRAEISKMQQDFGITDYAKVEELMLQRAANIMNELAKTESQRAQLESQLSLLMQGKDASASAQEQLKMRQEYISADATVKALAERVAQVETELLLAKQTKANDHPEVESKTNLLKALKKRVVEAKDEVGRAFDKLMADRAEETRVQNIDRVKAELEHNRVYEQKLRMRIDKDNKEGLEMAKGQSRIQALRDELEAVKAMYDEVNRRITDIRMEPQTPSLYELEAVKEEE